MAQLTRTSSERRRLQSELLMRALEDYYNKNEDAFRLVATITAGDGPVSLRNIDWYVTNHCRDNPTSVDDVDLYRDYRKQLKAYTKALFDPFRRRAHVSLTVGGQTLETTIAQLNFFRWFTSLGGEYVARANHASAGLKKVAPSEPPRPVVVRIKRTSAIEFI